MTLGSRKIVIIGGGIAGLCAGVYAQACGYQAEVLEQHTTPGGLATSWKRGDYRFETCIHWLVGSSPEGLLNAQWREVFDIDRLKFHYAEEYQRVESDGGQSLRVYADVNRMEAEFLREAPDDEDEIKAFTAAIRVLADLPLQDLINGSWPRRAWAMLRLAPRLPLLQHWATMSAADYGKRFKHDLLRRFFGDNGTAEMSVIALVLMFAWMNRSNAGYPIGGSKAIIDLIVERFRALGGTLRTDVKVAKIIIENDVATGVHLASGETIVADWVISAADGGEPLQVDPQTALTNVTFRIFHYDPTFAPPGKTAITCFLPTFNFAYWVALQRNDPARYEAEKSRIADAVVAVLDRRLPGLSQRIETVDVSTPATVIRFTGNWKGSMEGFLPTPGSLFASRRQTLPGLGRLLRVGQWVSPGGGLPTGLMTARAAIQRICRQDGVPFLPQATARANGHAA